MYRCAKRRIGAGKVALNNRVCRSLSQRRRIFSMSGRKPDIEHAIGFVQNNDFEVPCIKGSTRHMVQHATRSSDKHLSTVPQLAIWPRIGWPPYSATALIGRKCESLLNSPRTWTASSRVGTRTSANGRRSPSNGTHSRIGNHKCGGLAGTGSRLSQHVLFIQRVRNDPAGQELVTRIPRDSRPSSFREKGLIAQTNRGAPVEKLFCFDAL